MAVDPRFYKVTTGLSYKALASISGLDPRDFPDKDVTGISSFEAAKTGEMCFVETVATLSSDPRTWRHAVCLISESLGAKVKDINSFLAVSDPRKTFFQLAAHLYLPRLFDAADGTSQIHPSASLGPGSQIASGVAIGPRTQIGANSVIGPGVQIGSDCHIGAGTSIFFTLVGNNVQILSGARLGESGFGLISSRTELSDLPHFGRVILQDNVTIGANSCVDRGLLEDTLIGEGTKIDNLCHIGHNTHIGRYVVMAAFGGISGSARIGDGVKMGGRVGLIDHLVIGKEAQIGAGSAVFENIPAGEVWAGAPAKPIRTWQRELIWLKRAASRTGKK